MTTLFKHILEGIEENANMNNLHTLCEGIKSSKEAIEIFCESFKDELVDGEMETTIKALDIIIESGEKSYYEPECQKAIVEWNMKIWGQNFMSNRGSEPYGG